MSSSAPQQLSAGRVVVWVDGSAASIDALWWPARQAQLTGASLEAVIAWQYPMSSNGHLLGVEDDWEANAQTVIDRVMDLPDLRAELAPTRLVIEGHPAEVLSQKSTGADLLVTGPGRATHRSTQHIECA